MSAIRAACVVEQGCRVLSPMEQAAREDALVDWLCAHQLDTGVTCALPDTDVTIEAPNQLAAAVSGPAQNAALRWAAGGCAVRKLASGIQDSAMRISRLVAAVKGFTHMDQAMVADAVDLGSGMRGATDKDAAEGRGSCKSSSHGLLSSLQFRNRIRLYRRPAVQRLK